MDQSRLNDEVADVNLAGLWAALLKRRWVIAAAGAVGVLASAAYLFAVPSKYRAEALVQAVESSGGRSLAPMMAQLGGLSELTGFTLGAGSDRAVAIATLRSRAVIIPFIEQKGVLARLYSSSGGEERGKSGQARMSWQAYQNFTGSILKIIEDRKTGLVTVAVEWTDPKEAQAWVSELVERANQHLKAKAIEEGEKNLAFLQVQSSKIGQVELRQSLYSLIEGEMRKVMIAQGGEAIKTIDPAVVPVEPVWPRPGLSVIFGLLLGIIFGAVFVLAMRPSEWLTRAR